MPKTKSPSKATTERLTVIRSLVTARKTLLSLAVGTKDNAECEKLGEAFETLGEILAEIRKPLQPRPSAHGALPQE